MTGREAKQFVMDAAGYLVWLTQPPQAAVHDLGEALPTLIHDIMSLARGDEYFSPRVTGYARYFKEARQQGRAVKATQGARQ